MLMTAINKPCFVNLDLDEFNEALNFLKREDLKTLSDGAIPLKYNVVANIQSYDTEARKVLPFETHNNYYDIQFIIEGFEIIELANRESLKVSKPYDELGDCTFYEDPSYCSKLLLSAGDMVIVGPEDAHKSRCVYKEGCFVKKIVLKVPCRKQ